MNDNNYNNDDNNYNNDNDDDDDVHLHSAATIQIFSTAVHYYYPSCSRAAKQAFKGITRNKFQPGTHLPIYYTWVKRDNCGQMPSKDIHVHTQ